MRNFLLVILLWVAHGSFCQAQNPNEQIDFKKHELVWSAGLFKSWLTDTHLGFNKIDNKISPVFDEQKKIGLSLQSHYLYKPCKLFGLGAHLGIGLDVYSNIKTPVVLFGGSISLGDNNQFMIDFGWADGKRKRITDEMKTQLLDSNYSEIPEIYEDSELNTAFYIGVSYRLF